MVVKKLELFSSVNTYQGPLAGAAINEQELTEIIRQVVAEHLKCLVVGFVPDISLEEPRPLF